MVLTERAVVRGCGDGVVRVFRLGAVGRRFSLRGENKRESASLESASDGSRVGLLSSTTTRRTGIGSSATGRRFSGRQKGDAEGAGFAVVISCRAPTLE